MDIFSNPVLNREVRTAVRGRRAFLVRVVFIAALVAVVVVTWDSAVGRLTTEARGGQPVVAGSRTPAGIEVFAAEGPVEAPPGASLAVATLDIRQLPNLGRELLATLATALLLLLLAIVPAYAGGAICSEREQRTLEMTLVTRLGPYSLALGKLGATLLFSTLLLLAALPVLAALFVLGGVSVAEMAGVVAILLFSALFVAAVSLLWSARSRHTYQTIMFSYVTFLLLHFAAVPGIAAGLRWYGAKSSSGAYAITVELAEIVLDSDPVRGLSRIFAGHSGADLWLAPEYVTPMLLLMLALFAVELTTKAVARVDVEPGPSVWQRLMRWLVARERERQPGRGLRWHWLAERVDNPVLARDLRGRPLGRFDVVLRASYVGIIGAEVLCIAWPYVLVFSETAVAVMVGAVAAVTALAGVLGATSVTSEKERRTMETLLATPLRASDIVMGKFLSSFLNVQPLILLVLPVAVFGAIFQTVRPLTPLAMLLLAEAYAFAATAFGVLASVLSSRTARAVGATLLAVAAAWVGPTLVAALGVGYEWIPRCAAWAPASAVMRGMWYDGFAGSTVSWLVPEGLIGGLLLLIALRAAPIGLVCLLLAMGAFNRATRRGR